MKKFTGKFYFKLTLIVFTTLFITFLLFDGLLIMFMISNKINVPEHVAISGVRIPLVNFVLSLAVASLLIGFIIGLFWIKGFVDPLHNLKVNMSKVSKGKFEKMEDTYDTKEVGELVESFNIMVEGLQKIETLSESFTANISHEFKTPLSMIKGYTSLLEMNDYTEEEKKEYLFYINQAVNRLTNLTNSILLLNKVTNTEIMEISKYKLDDQLREAIISFEKRFEGKKINVQINLEEFEIESCKSLLMSVWSNLIDNAIKFSHENGEVCITLKKTDERVKIIISDNGIGMRKEELANIYERFYQVDTSHGSEGNGLGLSLVKSIVDKVKGRINVESEYNKGTTFIVELNQKAY